MKVIMKFICPVWPIYLSILNILEGKTYNTFDPLSILKQSKTNLFSYHSHTLLEVLGTFKVYNTTFD